MPRLILFAIIEGIGFGLLVLWLVGRTMERPAGSLPILVAAIVALVVGNLGVLGWVLGQTRRAGRIREGLCPNCGRPRPNSANPCPECGEPPAPS